MTSYENTTDYVTICPHDGKRCYPSRRQAKRARRSMPDRKGLRAYRCRFNSTWIHLGRLPQAAVWGFKTTHEIYQTTTTSTEGL